MGGLHTLGGEDVFRPYVRVLRLPGALIGYGATFLGSFPISMLGLSVLLLIRTSSGSMAQAGLVSGALSVGNACGLLVQGRLLDRYGQTVVLLAAGPTAGLALGGLTLAAVGHAPAPVLIMLSYLSGVAIPAVITCMRVLIPVMVSAPGDRRSAYALLGTQFNVAMISGPMVVSGLVVLSGPAAAVLTAAVAATVGGLVFAGTARSRHWRPAPAEEHRGVRLPGLLTSGMITVLGASFGAGLVGGLTSVAVPAVALTHHVTYLAGLLFAASSVGDIVAGIVYGSRVWRIALGTQLIICQIGGAVINGVLALLSGHPWAMFPAMTAGGAVQAPAGVANSALLDDVARPAFLGQSYTAMIAAGLGGSALGTTAGGRLSVLAEDWTLFVAAGTAGLAIACWTVLRRRSLSRLQTVP
ncbi:MFS transporter [Microlunatus soli]|uniref:Major Facilitator Superfamily protein n=1 Tax=Microlunatus soli TaxID=630515 RepID=A0A1H1WJP5_9ACTN|nr:MFS transporter [Microlunatus soli]SDS97538.1 Major Facilitator Superfamily protein [Microlunatus soli]